MHQAEHTRPDRSVRNADALQDARAQRATAKARGLLIANDARMVRNLTRLAG